MVNSSLYTSYDVVFRPKSIFLSGVAFNEQFFDSIFESIDDGSYADCFLRLGGEEV